MTEQMIFEWLQRKYGQSADARQKAMGLVYMTAETHDLAKELAKLFAASSAAHAETLRTIDQFLDNEDYALAGETIYQALNAQVSE